MEDDKMDTPAGLTDGLRRFAAQMEEAADRYGAVVDAMREAAGRVRDLADSLEDVNDR
jgi:hypothetical protein